MAQSALEYVTRLLQTPTRLANQEADRRAQSQQRQFLDLYRSFQEQNQDLSGRAIQAETEALERRGPIIEAQRERERRGQVRSQIDLDANRASLTNSTLSTAGQVRTGLIGAEANADVERTNAAFGGADRLAQTQGGIDRGLQRDRLDATRELVALSQDYDTGMVDRFTGPTPLAEQVLNSVDADRNQRDGLIRYLVEQSQPTGFDRALQILGPTALALVAGLAK
jgi:hypothetical protein